MAIDLSTPVKQSSAQVSTSLDEEVVILNLESSLYFGLEGVAACIWNAIREPTNGVEICRKVMDQFDVGEEQCRREVLEFLEQLVTAGLIETSSSTSDG
ncbi:MAG: PqqD family protein [Methylocystis sp.]